jgi:hypothetical protein
MKKAVKLIALALVAVTALMLLASCATKLSGTYKCDDTKVLDVSLTFDGDKVTAKGKLGIIATEVEGTYEIKGDKITITFENDAFKIGGEKSFEKDGDTIKIGGVSYTKEK